MQVINPVQFVGVAAEIHSETRGNCAISHSSGQDQRDNSMPKSANLSRLSARPG